jgi:hypothetical protein
MGTLLSIGSTLPGLGVLIKSAEALPRRICRRSRRHGADLRLFNNMNSMTTGRYAIEESAMKREAIVTRRQILSRVAWSAQHLDWRGFDLDGSIRKIAEFL